MKNSKSKKVTKKGEYYFAKGFKVLVSCVKKNRYSLMYMPLARNEKRKKLVLEFQNFGKFCCCFSVELLFQA